jgi:hypothetical protein
MLCALLFLFCGAPQEGPKAEGEKAEVGKQTAIYYSALNEGDLQNLIKAIPVFKVEVEKLENKLEPLEGSEDFQSMFGRYAALNQQIPGLDAKLRSAGMAWDQFWPAYGKTAMAIGAMMVDSAMFAVQEQMKGQPSQVIDQAMSNFEAARAVYKDVPQVNKDLVKKYWRELKVAFEID